MPFCHGLNSFLGSDVLSTYHIFCEPNSIAPTCLSNVDKTNELSLGFSKQVAEIQNSLTDSLSLIRDIFNSFPCVFSLFLVAMVHYVTHNTLTGSMTILPGAAQLLISSVQIFLETSSIGFSSCHNFCITTIFFITFIGFFHYGYGRYILFATLYSTLSGATPTAQCG